MDDDPHALDPRMASEGLDRPAQDGLPPKQSVLLGNAGSGPFAAAGGDNQGDCFSHESSGSKANAASCSAPSAVPTCALQHFAYTIGSRTDCLLYRQSNAWGR